MYYLLRICFSGAPADACGGNPLYLNITLPKLDFFAKKGLSLWRCWKGRKACVYRAYGIFLHGGCRHGRGMGQKKNRRGEERVLPAPVKMRYDKEH